MPEGRHRQELFWRPGWRARPKGHRGLIRGILLLVALSIGAWALSSRHGPPEQTPAPAPTATVATPTPTATVATPRSRPERQQGASPQNPPWRGDLDGMVRRRLVRILVVPNRTDYFLDRGRPRGLVQEYGAELERRLNAKFKTGARSVRVFYVPVGRDELLPALVAGRGDIAAANLTITPERLSVVDFSAPFQRNVREIVVTGPEFAAAGHARRPFGIADPIAALQQLSGQRRGPRPGAARPGSYWADAGSSGGGTGG